MELTENFLAKYIVLYYMIVYGAGSGETILVNDCKPSGLRTALAVNTQRDRFMEDEFEIDETL